jgi:hypothetical protein
MREHGIYLVAWFECGFWKPLRRKLKARTVEEAQEEVAAICRNAASLRTTIVPYLLDCSFPA